MATVSKPLKWHGGKHYLADRIISLIPPHTHYVEPYAGGLSVLFAKPAELIEGHSEVVNDLNGNLVNFWDVLSRSESFGELVRICEATPFSEEVWNSAQEMEACKAVRTTRDVKPCCPSQHSGLFCASSRHFPMRESEIRRDFSRVYSGKP
jgi:site-specific DNA-adenine methylase